MFLTIAAILLLVVIGIQNYLYPPLREETISDGLYGPYHWFLDAAYFILGCATIYTFKDQGIPTLLSWFVACGLAITAISNTFSTFIDKITDGKHAIIHTWFTIGMLLSALALEYTQQPNGKLWLIANLATPIIVGSIAAFSKRFLAGPAAEKAGIVVLCIWLMSLQWF